MRCVYRAALLSIRGSSAQSSCCGPPPAIIAMRGKVEREIPYVFLFRWTLAAGRQAAPLATAIPLFPQSAGVCVTRMSGGSQWSAAPTTSMCVSMALDNRSLELLTLDLRTARTLPIECAPLHRLAHRSASAELHRLVETLPISSRASLVTCCGWLAKSLIV